MLADSNLQHFCNSIGNDLDHDERNRHGIIFGVKSITKNLEGKKF